MAIRNVTATTCSDLTNVEIIIDDSGIDFSKIYQLPDGRCVTLTSGTTSSYPANSYFPYGPYNTCTLCQVPLSGSTGGNVDICQALCSGNTTSIVAPHATFTNAQFKAVVQMNTVLLGGNGLNA